MTLRIVLSQCEDPASGLDWPEQTPEILDRIAEKLSSYPDGPVQYEANETNHGIGADWPTIVLEIFKWGAGLAFSIPATHKLIRNSISEWKLILQHLRKFLVWAQGTVDPVSYSIEVAFLEALEILEAETNPHDLEFLNSFSIPGKPAFLPASFDTSLLNYYGFVFREESSEKAYLVVLTSQLEQVVFETFKLDHRFLIKDE